MDDFKRELAALINRHSLDNESNTPDFVLAEFLVGCLASFNEATRRRDRWYGVQLEPGRIRVLDHRASVGRPDDTPTAAADA